MHEMFPHLTHSTISVAIEKARGDPQLALDALLSALQVHPLVRFRGLLHSGEARCCRFAYITLSSGTCFSRRLSVCAVLQEDAQQAAEGLATAATSATSTATDSDSSEALMLLSFWKALLQIS
jgi:hypothetical protein